MHWPELSAECTKAIAEALEDVVKNHPADPVEHMAKLLAERSGLSLEEFENHFEECKRRPRTHELEEMCPPGKDPIQWATTRYNDHVIGRTLAEKAANLAADIFSNDPSNDMRDLFHRASVAYPEFQYLRRGSQEEIVAAQTVRAVYLGCSNNQDVLEPTSLDDPDPALAFHCRELLECARTNMFEPVVNGEGVTQPEVVLDTILICCMFRVLGTNTPFQARLGGGQTDPRQALAHAFDKHCQELPSYQRLPTEQRDHVKALLQAHFYLESLAIAEAVPAHFARTKELVGSTDSALRTAVATSAAEMLVSSRTASALRSSTEHLRLACHCVLAMSKYTASRAFDMYLRKRAERHTWRLVKDDFQMRCIIRLCLLARLEATADWEKMQAAMLELSAQEQEVLVAEIGRKDGVAEMPVFVLNGLSDVLAQAWANEQLGPKGALRLLARILQDATRACVRLASMRMVPLNLECLVSHARNYRNNGVPFEDTPFMVSEALPSEGGGGEGRRLSELIKAGAGEMVLKLVKKP